MITALSRRLKYYCEYFPSPAAAALALTGGGFQSCRSATVARARSVVRPITPGRAAVPGPEPGSTASELRGSEPQGRNLPVSPRRLVTRLRHSGWPGDSEYAQAGDYHRDG